MGHFEVEKETIIPQGSPTWQHNDSYAWLRKMSKFHHQASFVIPRVPEVIFFLSNGLIVSEALCARFPYNPIN